MKTQNNPITESTAVKSNPEVKENGMSPLWQSVLVGGVPGILIGAFGRDIIEDIHAKDPKESDPAGPDQQDEPMDETPSEILEAHSVTDDMSFSEAFAAARAEVGPGGAFVWHGQVYGTYRGDDPEWQEMSDEARTEHSQEILSQVHPAPYTPTENEPEIVPAPATEDSSEIEDVTPVAETTEDANDIDVHILGVGELQAPDGSVAQVGVGTIDDHVAVFADTDGDNEVDTVLIDTNDNARLDYDEIYDATGSGITMEELQNSVVPSVTDVMDETLDADMPDNTLFI
jgi:hypothetical protein